MKKITLLFLALGAIDASYALANHTTVTLTASNCRCTKTSGGLSFAIRETGDNTNSYECRSTTQVPAVEAVPAKLAVPAIPAVPAVAEAFSTPVDQVCLSGYDYLSDVMGKKGCTVDLNAKLAGGGLSTKDACVRDFIKDYRMTLAEINKYGNNVCKYIKDKLSTDASLVVRTDCPTPAPPNGKPWIKIARAVRDQCKYQTVEPKAAIPAVPAVKAVAAVPGVPAHYVYGGIDCTLLINNSQADQ